MRKLRHPKQGMTVGRGTCSECGQPCSVVIEDFSFDHAFGTHIEYGYMTECCNTTIYDFEPDNREKYDDDPRV